MIATVALANAAFDPADRLARFTAGAAGAGAIVSFTGLARGTGQDGRLLDALVLETYRGVTLASMEAIVADAGRRFAISHADVVHRYGSIAPGEPIVFVATAAAHRRAAFEAADYLMDRLKTDAVFWKREEGPDGSHWIEPTGADATDAARWMTTQD
jgi:molybdopterin synthase catalytic subunit